MSALVLAVTILALTCAGIVTVLVRSPLRGGRMGEDAPANDSHPATDRETARGRWVWDSETDLP